MVMDSKLIKKNKRKGDQMIAFFYLGLAHELRCTANLRRKQVKWAFVHEFGYNKKFVVQLSS
jgi:hypothetical protein